MSSVIRLPLTVAFAVSPLNRALANQVLAGEPGAYEVAEDLLGRRAGELHHEAQSTAYHRALPVRLGPHRFTLDITSGGWRRWWFTTTWTRPDELWLQALYASDPRHLHQCLGYELALLAGERRGPA